MATGKAILDHSVRQARTPRPAGRSRAGALIAALAVGFLGSGTACRADGLVISAPDVTAAPGTSGSFDVTITNTNPLVGGASFDVASDTVELSFTGPSGVSFTGVSIATADTYIYGATPRQTLGLTFSSSIFPGTTFETNDFLFSLGAQTIGPQQTFGLVHVTYTVAPGATLEAGVSPSAPTLLYSMGRALPSPTSRRRAQRFTISSVPEPSGLILLAAGCIGSCLPSDEAAPPSLKRPCSSPRRQTLRPCSADVGWISPSVPRSSVPAPSLERLSSPARCSIPFLEWIPISSMPCSGKESTRA